MNVNSNEIQLTVKYNQVLKNNKIDFQWQDWADMNSNIYLLASFKAKVTHQTPTARPLCWHFRNWLGMMVHS